ncbi:MAG: histidine-type phosphatase [Marinifilaceae bacterium]
MKSVYLLLAFLGWTLWSVDPCEAQNILGINAQAQCVLGTATPYAFPQYYITPAPKGYDLFYINHVGRHGSRYPTGNENIELLLKAMTDAQSKGMLKTHGKRLKKQLDNLHRIYQDRWGQLSSLGIEQWQQIGTRMHATFPKITDGTIIAISDDMERCERSMQACLDGIYARGEKRNVNTSIMERENNILNFFKTNKHYLAFKENKSWQEDLDKYTRKQLSPNFQLKPFFKWKYIHKHPDREKLAQALYYTYIISHDVPQAQTPDIYFSRKELRRTWHTENARQYMSKGPYPGYHNVQINIAYPLLEHFLTSAAEAVATDTLTATLRFAHAETIIPFSALLGIPMAAQEIDDLSQIHRYWQDCHVSPMAANIQWLFYRNAEGHCLVKILLNEREVAIPIYTKNYPYYSWDAVQAYYINRIREAKTQLK